MRTLLQFGCGLSLGSCFIYMTSSIYDICYYMLLCLWILRVKCMGQFLDLMALKSPQKLKICVILGLWTIFRKLDLMDKFSFPNSSRTLKIFRWKKNSGQISLKNFLSRSWNCGLQSIDHRHRKNFSFQILQKLNFSSDSLQVDYQAITS